MGFGERWSRLKLWEKAAASICLLPICVVILIALVPLYLFAGVLIASHLLTGHPAHPDDA